MSRLTKFMLAGAATAIVVPGMDATTEARERFFRGNRATVVQRAAVPATETQLVPYISASTPTVAELEIDEVLQSTRRDMQLQQGRPKSQQIPFAPSRTMTQSSARVPSVFVRDGGMNLGHTEESWQPGKLDKDGKVTRPPLVKIIDGMRVCPYSNEVLGPEHN